MMINHSKTKKKSAVSTPQPAEDIFYVIRHPDGWRAHAQRFNDGRDIGHPDFWEQRLAATVAAAWHLRRHLPAAVLESRLGLCCYGFPRGRVLKRGRQFVICHGNDLKPFMGVTRRNIERLFGIERIAKWEEDEHEHCQVDEKETVREVLHLVEDWPAVGPFDFEQEEE